MIVVDTNVVSELMRATPSERVLAWMRSRETGTVHTTSITLAELRYGVERLPTGRRQATLRTLAEEIFESFADRVLSFDRHASAWYAAIVAGRDCAGLPIEGFDAQIAAICRSHGAPLATRNSKDFRHTGVEQVDPWQHT